MGEGLRQRVSTMSELVESTEGRSRNTLPIASAAANADESTITVASANDATFRRLGPGYEEPG
jgi:hypothetical protein